MRGIIFAAENVNKSLARRKWQTRRIVNPQSLFEGKDGILHRFPDQSGSIYKTGDILYIKEPFAPYLVGQGFGRKGEINGYLYRYDFVDGKMRGFQEDKIKWISARNMPEKAARTFIRIKRIRAMRLQDISESDAYAEGCESLPCKRCDERGDEGGQPCEDCAGRGWFSCVDQFRSHFKAINGQKSWNENKFVWVYDYETKKSVEEFAN